MTEEFSKTQAETYMQQWYNADDPVRHEMEALADGLGFPIIGPLAGRHLYQLALTINARRVFELGSGFGYSALWFARAVGATGQVHCTELSAANIRRAKDFLSRAGLWERITYHQAEATAALQRTGGQWDILYNDIDKDGYPATIELAEKYLRPGGLFITDNIFWHGRPFTGDTSPATQGVVEFTRRLFDHPGFVTTILPVRDGLTVALKK
ncbi:MAG: putative O-methyltransferase [Anaerolineae bacterium]|nr:putative O-methyltransferase [Anaerolineae bacterium]